MSALQIEFERYYPETSDEDVDFVRNPFKFPVEKLPDEDESLELKIILQQDKSMKKSFFHNSGLK